MDNAAIVKYLGIFIVLVMAVSMLAAAFLYGPQQETVPQNVELTPETTEFTYQASFDTTVISELSFLNFKALTTEIDKTKIDSALSSIQGVSRVMSKFYKSQSEKWIYDANIYLTRSTNSNEIKDQISDINYFSKELGEQEFTKKVTVSSPGKVELKNSQLNITRDYNFDGIILTALVYFETRPLDKISVNGTIILKGKDITFVELIESNNSSSAPQTYSVDKTLEIKSLEEMVMFNGKKDLNTFIDSEEVKKQIQLIDSTSQVFAFNSSKQINVVSSVPFSEGLLIELQLIDGISSVEKTDLGLVIDLNLSKIDSIAPKVKQVVSKEDFSAKMIYPTMDLFGRTVSSKSAQISSYLLSKGFSSSFKQQASFDLNSVFVPELSKDLSFNNSFMGGVKLGRKVGEKVNLSLELSISRDKIVQVTGEEK